MDDSRFDALARRLSDSRPRRPLLGAGLTALAAMGTGLAWSGEADAKKKKKKKKKKKGNTTPPPTTKPPERCPNGQKLCNGRCIDVEDCCVSGDCASGQVCTNGFCSCSANEITCGNLCCDKASQTCENDAGVVTCRAGTCPSTNFCASGGPGTRQYLCANSTSGFCICTNTVDTVPQKACVNINAVTSCGATCANSGQCPSGSVCIETGANCSCTGNFCAPICTL